MCSLIFVRQMSPSILPFFELTISCSIHIPLTHLWVLMCTRNDVRSKWVTIRSKVCTRYLLVRIRSFIIENFRMCWSLWILALIFKFFPRKNKQQNWRLENHLITILMTIKCWEPSKEIATQFFKILHQLTNFSKKVILCLIIEWQSNLKILLNT